ncbi:MAG: M4 family metallopeptidase, partial [Bacteroidia bacterium]
MNPTITKITGFAFASLVCFGTSSMFAQQTKLNLGAATVVSTSTNTNLPNFIKLSPGQIVTNNDFPSWAIDALGLSNTVTFKPYDVQNDNLGETHTRYKEYINNIPVDGSMLITHSKGGRIEMVNGDYFANFNAPASPAISEETALADALKKVNAVKYKWQNQEETQAMRDALHQPDFTYFPKGELVVVHKLNADYSSANMRLAYKFNIYAEKPLSRAYIYVDAKTGEVISQEEIIHTADVVGTGHTKYSGVETMTSDNYGTATQYRLRETGRGNGIQTYNCNTGTTYTNTDFTNTSATWNVTGTDQAASDAHWGAEETYDYYQTVHSRNSIDNAGYALLSYVHYDVNYDNAFWDGTRMTYGDGNVSTGFLIMTALDVCGHEITHGLTSFTAGLNGGGTGEPDALNEGFSDIFGTTIEAFARPSAHDWLIGADITCNSSGVQDHLGIRNMSNPNAFSQPDTYNGTYWDAAGEPHNNNGPSIFWYYLLCQGGSGTNDIGNAYSVTGITMAEARMIAFRGLTNYFTPSTTYANARTYTIQAAIDLYGGCSPEVIATTNAWYAVGVGAAFVATPTTASFTANSTTACALPFTVNFNNTSVNGSTAVWHFGDGTTSTAYSPSHTYTTAGTFNVKLTVSSACGTDSVVHSSYITITLPPAPTTTPAFSCTSPSTVTLSAAGGGTLNWYSAATGGTSLHTGTTYTTPSLST